MLLAPERLLFSKSPNKTFPLPWGNLYIAALGEPVQTASPLSKLLIKSVATESNECS